MSINLIRFINKLVLLSDIKITGSLQNKSNLFIRMQMFIKKGFYFIIIIGEQISRDCHLQKTKNKNQFKNNRNVTPMAIISIQLTFKFN